MRSDRKVLLCLALASLLVPPLIADEIWIDMPFVKQSNNGCGAAVISMVLQYWAVHGQVIAREVFDPVSIQNALYVQSAKGIYASGMEQYFRQHGFQTFVFASNWSDLYQHLSKGRPLIVSLSPNGKGGRLHYVVVAGIDFANDIVLVNDPAERKLLKMKRSSFEEIRKPVRNWTLLALPEN